MKPWRLRVVCIPHLKKVLEAIEQIEDYCVEQSFQNIEEALTDFLEKLEDYKEEHYNEEYSFLDVKLEQRRNERHIDR